MLDKHHGCFDELLGHPPHPEELLLLSLTESLFFASLASRATRRLDFKSISLLLACFFLNVVSSMSGAVMWCTGGKSKMSSAGKILSVTGVGLSYTSKRKHNGKTKNAMVRKMNKTMCKANEKKMQHC